MVATSLTSGLHASVRPLVGCECVSWATFSLASPASHVDSQLPGGDSERRCRASWFSCGARRTGGGAASLGPARAWLS